MKSQLTILILFSVIVFSSCEKKYVPKPRGYFRISFPEKRYQKLDLKLPYTFDVATYSKAIPDTESGAEPGWINIATPANKAFLHISYASLKNNLAAHIENSRKFVYKHTVKADAIEEQIFINKEHKVYGTIYFIEGNAASPIQFYLTDSTKNFLRGALYIREIPNMDSIQPVLNFLKPDVLRLIETTQWNN